jgi:hypothetical protein
MKKLCVALGFLVVPVFAAMPMAFAAQPPAKTFVAVLSADEEVPHCASATNASRGGAVFHVRDDGTVDFHVIANNLPGTIIAAHIHVAPTGVAGPIVQPLPPTPGVEHGVVAQGSFTNPSLVAAIRANPDGYYVNVHSTSCLRGVIRGQLGDHGPLNN